MSNNDIPWGESALWSSTSSLGDVEDEYDVVSRRSDEDGDGFSLYGGSESSGRRHSVASASEGEVMTPSEASEGSGLRTPLSSLFSELVPGSDDNDVLSHESSMSHSSDDDVDDDDDGNASSETDGVVVGSSVGNSVGSVGDSDSTKDAGTNEASGGMSASDYGVLTSSSVMTDVSNSNLTLRMPSASQSAMLGSLSEQGSTDGPVLEALGWHKYPGAAYYPGPSAAYEFGRKPVPPAGFTGSGVRLLGFGTGVVSVLEIVAAKLHRAGIAADVYVLSADRLKPSLLVPGTGHYQYQTRRGSALVRVSGNGPDEDSTVPTMAIAYYRANHALEFSPEDLADRLETMFGKNVPMIAVSNQLLDPLAGPVREICVASSAWRNALGVDGALYDVPVPLHELARLHHYDLLAAFTDPTPNALPWVDTGADEGIKASKPRKIPRGGQLVTIWQLATAVLALFALYRSSIWLFGSSTATAGGAPNDHAYGPERSSSLSNSIGGSGTSFSIANLRFELTVDNKPACRTSVVDFSLNSKYSDIEGLEILLGSTSDTERPMRLITWGSHGVSGVTEIPLDFALGMASPPAECEQAKGSADDAKHRNVTDTSDAKKTLTEAARNTSDTQQVLADLGVPFARELTQAASYAAEFAVWLFWQVVDAVTGFVGAVTEGSRVAGERIVADAPVVASAAAKHAANARHAAEESYHHVVHTVAPVAVRTTTDVAVVIGDAVAYLAKIWTETARVVYEEVRTVASAAAGGLERAARSANRGADKASRGASRWVHDRKRELAAHARARYRKGPFKFVTSACIAGPSNAWRASAHSAWAQMLEWPHVRAARRNAKRLSNAAGSHAKGLSEHDAATPPSANKKCCRSSCSSRSKGRRSGNNRRY